MTQQSDIRTSREALDLMGAWLWLFVGVVCIVGGWGVWTDWKFFLICIGASLAFILRDRRKQRLKRAVANH